MQKELAGRENDKCESGSVCVSAPPEPINSQYVCVFPHENAVSSAPPEYKTPIYPMAQLDALKFDPTSTVLRPRQPQQDAQAAQAAPRKRRGRERCSWLLYRLKQRETLNKQRERQCKKCGLCASNEHDFSSCTKCRLCKNDGHWAQDCPEARKAD